MKLQRLFLGAALTISCLGFAAIGFAEAKAMDMELALRGSYSHVENFAGFKRSATMFKGARENSWAEVVVEQEDGMTGGTKQERYIGDVLDGPRNDTLFNIKRQVEYVRAGDGRLQAKNVTAVNLGMFVYIQDEETFKLARPEGAAGTNEDITGNYSKVDMTLLSPDAAMYLVERFCKSNAQYGARLEGAKLMAGGPSGEVVEVRIVEDHPDHVVTRETLQVHNTGDIYRYDVALDKAEKVGP